MRQLVILINVDQMNMVSFTWK